MASRPYFLAAKLGKTTTLLTLTRHLIAVAKADTDQPIPVVFNLSSWAEQQLADYISIMQK